MIARPPFWLQLRGLIPPCERADLLLERLRIPDVPEIPNTAYHPDAAMYRLRSLAPAVPRGTEGSRDRIALNASKAEELSRSAGVSWDELDAEFTRFFSERETRTTRWEEEGDKTWQLAEEKAKKTETTPTRQRHKSISNMTRWSKKYMSGLTDTDLFKLLDECVSEKRMQREMAERLRNLVYY